MRHAVLKEGRFAPLFFLLLLSAAASADEVPGSDLELCAEQPSDELKLACFEALAARYRKESPAAAPPPPESPAVAEPAAGPAAAAAAASAALPAANADRTAAPAGSATRELDPATGSEHLQARAADEAPAEAVIVARVVAVRRRPATRELLFEMDNGQVWRQMEARHYPYPKDGAFDVEIRRGLMGDYQMRVGGEGRMTRIVRLR